MAIDSAKGAQACPWRPEEFGDVWRHQLGAALAVEIAAIDPVSGIVVADELTRQMPPMRSVGDALHRTDTPLIVLQAVEAVGVHYLERDGEALPRALARGLRDLARVRLCELSGAVPDAELKGAAQTLIGAEWLDEYSRKMVIKCLR